MIVVLTTGGTIASRQSHQGDLLAVDRGAELVDIAGLRGQVRVEEFCRVGSYAMTLSLLASLSERVRQLCADDSVAGVVVTHGTDTMEESTYLTDLGHARRVPVVFTGAQLPADHPETDGPANLRDAVLLAGDPSVAALGVLIAMAGRAYAASEATKAHSTAPDPWAAGGATPLAVVVDGRVTVLRQPGSPPSPLVMPVHRAERRVDLVKLAVGVDGAMVRSAVAGGAEAVVLEAFGLGNAPRDVAAAVGEAVEAGVLVAVVTRCGAGPASAAYGDGGGADLERAGALLLSDFTGQRARILLAAALSCADSPSAALDLVHARTGAGSSITAGSKTHHDAPRRGALMHVTIPAGHGRAFRLTAGQRLRVTTTEGGQVVDTWALTLPDLDEAMSMEHTRARLLALSPHVGDDLWSNRRRPILRLVEDSSPGVHDTLIAACDPERYAQLGHRGAHGNCADNFRAALAELGLVAPPVPAPLNVFMNIPVALDGRLSFEPSPARPGDAVTLEAVRDVVVVLSACPQDLVPINGTAMRPTDIDVEVRQV